MINLHRHLLEQHGLDLTKEELKKIQKLCRVKPKFNFKEALVKYGFEDTTAEEWMEIRKVKKAINSENAFKRFIKQIELSKNDKNEILNIIVERQWKSYSHSWETTTKTAGKNEQPKDVNDIWK